jgi:hypothetical protein
MIYASSYLARVLYVALLVGVMALLFGWSLAPTVAPTAPVAALLAYAAIVHIGSRPLAVENRKATYGVALFGLLSAGALVPSLLIQYTGRSIDNRYPFFGAFACWFVAGLVGQQVSERLRIAVLSATLAGMIGSLCNVMALLVSYYLLRNSPAQERFFFAEGSHADFARNGTGDFTTWIIGDMFGGAFFHLVLGALIAAALGAMAGFVGRALTWARHRSLEQPRL